MVKQNLSGMEVKTHKVNFYTKGVRLYMPKNNKPLEDLYGIVSKDVGLVRTKTKSGKPVDVFSTPGKVLVDIEFPEFTCLCPKTNQPDFGTFRLVYIPNNICIELKALKYYLNAFRNEGHFHEQICRFIYEDLQYCLKPTKMQVILEFNTRGGLSTTVHAGDDIV